MHVVNSTTEEEFMGIHVISAGELIFWCSIYGLIAFLSVTGNALVIYIIMSRPKMQNITNYFIFNLALGDAITGMLAIPFKFQAAAFQQWYLPSFMCKLVTFIETVSLSVSVFTLTGTAVDRLRAVLFPTRAKLTKHGALIIIAFIWFFSVLMSLPFGLLHRVEIFGHPDSNMTLIYQCLPVHNDNKFWKIYNIYLTIIQYYVPLFIVDGTYCAIAYKVWFTTTHADSENDPRARAFEQSKRRVIKMLVIVVAVFTFCWLPYETYLVLNEVAPRINEYYYINVLFFCCHWLAMSNSCLNPIIYGIYNEKFQKEYKRVFFSICGQLQQDDVDMPNSSYRTNTSDYSPNDPRYVSRNLIKQEALQQVFVMTYRPGEMLAVRKVNDGSLLVPPKVEQYNSCHSYIASELGKDDDDDDDF